MTDQYMTPKQYQALAIAHALEFYERTGMKVNTAYTPKNMMATASMLTGKKFKARDYKGAATALRDSIRGLSKLC